MSKQPTVATSGIAGLAARLDRTDHGISMIMKPSEALAGCRAELRQLASHYGLLRPRIFGSVLTGTDDEQSDLDLLVDPAETTSLLS